MRYKSYRNYRRVLKSPAVKIYSGIYRFVMILLVVIAFSLAYFINEEKQFVDLEVVRQQLEKIEFSSFSKWIPFEKWFEKDQSVNSSTYYKQVSDFFYEGDHNEAKTIYDGIVLLVKEDEGIVIIKQDNGVITTYGSLKYIDANTGERLLKGSTIGAYEPYLYMSFTKDNQSVDYTEAINIYED